MQNEKVVLITGASGGIGEKIALEYINRGFSVYLNYNSLKSAEKLKGLEKAYPSISIKAIQANVAESSQVQQMFKSVIDEKGKIDVLVNNAGIASDNLAIRMSDEEFDKVININLKGTFYCMREACKYMMRARSGSIINISSIVGLHGNIGQANYSASKAGIIGLTKSFAREYASKNIIVNAVAPGAVKTAMTDVLSDAIKEKMIENIPLKRFAEPSEIASLVYFLSTSKYITGQVISIDGGMSI